MNLGPFPAQCVKPAASEPDTLKILLIINVTCRWKLYGIDKYNAFQQGRNLDANYWYSTNFFREKKEWKLNRKFSFLTIHPFFTHVVKMLQIFHNVSQPVKFCQVEPLKPVLPVLSDHKKKSISNTNLAWSDHLAGVRQLILRCCCTWHRYSMYSRNAWRKFPWATRSLLQ